MGALRIIVIYANTYTRNLMLNSSHCIVE
uniref:Uncharacterized protein n=1 Tax=Arundo donax TaxID=35708 RepID=A0A0A8Y706_ARUDO